MRKWFHFFFLAMFRTACKGFPVVAVRGDVELGRLNGACLESCFKQCAVTENNVDKPLCFRFRENVNQPWQERSDVDVLDLVWPATAKAYEGLKHFGYTAVHTQSTYKRADLLTTESSVETRSKRGFSVDVTAQRGAHKVWLETEWSNAQELPRTVTRATRKLEKYKSAAKEAEQYPQRLIQTPLAPPRRAIAHLGRPLTARFNSRRH